MNDRRAVLEKVSDERKAKYREVIIISFMSSEESGEERDENQELKPVLYVNSLPWRSPIVNQLFSLLDNKIERGKSEVKCTHELWEKFLTVSNQPICPMIFGGLPEL